MFWLLDSVGSVLGDPKNVSCKKFELSKFLVINISEKDTCLEYQIMKI